MLRYTRLPTPENVANSSRFTVKLPIGPTYASAHISFGGTVAAANITNLELAINGRPVRRYASAAHLDKFNQRRGKPAMATNQILSFYFRRDWLEEIEEAELFDLGTARPDPSNPMDAQSPVIESITISGDLSGATNPTAEAWAYTSSKVRPLRMLEKCLYFPKTFSVSTAGTEGDFDAFPIGYANAALMEIHLVETVDNTITKARLTANIAGSSVEIIENATVAQLSDLEKSFAKPATTQAGMVHIDLLGSGQLLDALPLSAVGDLRARLTCLHASNTSEVVTTYACIADTFQGA